MNPRVITFGIVFSGLFWLGLAACVMLALCSCETDPRAGMVAARIVGMPKYLAFHQRDRLDSAAVFPFAGVWWCYHPDFGSFRTLVPASQAPPRIFAPSIWTNVLPEPRDADLLNGCLPRAIASVRQHGGRVAVSGQHAYRIP